MITNKNRDEIKVVEELICSHIGVSSDTLHTNTKKQDIVDIRQEIIYLVKKFYPRITCKVLGEYFNGKNHSTISQGISKIEDLIMFDKTYRSHMEGLSSVVQSSLFSNEKDFDKLKQILIREITKAEKCSDILPVLRIVVG